jgi:hypothetical protein
VALLPVGEGELLGRLPGPLLHPLGRIHGGHGKKPVSSEGQPQPTADLGTAIEVGRERPDGRSGAARERCGSKASIDVAGDYTVAPPSAGDASR